MLFDLRLAVLHLWRRPAFAFAALSLVALGAGSNAAVLSVVRAVLLRPLPFAAPERLVSIWPDGFVSNEEIRVWRSRVPRLSDIASISPGWLMALVAQGAEPLSATGARVSDNFFTTLGVSAALGRTLVPGDGVLGAPSVVVIADRVWRQQFAADPGILGRSVLVDQMPHTVVGVMGPRFEFAGRQSDLWVPLPFAAGTVADKSVFSEAFGRLRPGATAEVVTRDLVALVPELRAQLGHPADWGQTMRAESLADVTTGPARPALLLLLAAVGLVLILATANIGALVLGRSLERRRELAVRTAIGASQGRLLRQLLLEQALVGAAGGLAGLAVARTLLPVLIAGMPPEVPRQQEIAIDGAVFGAVWLISVALAMVAALLPALLSGRAGAQPLLRSTQHTHSSDQHRMLGGLVSLQMALAVVLGVGAGLMLRSMWHLQRVDPGFDAAGVVTFRAQTTAKYRALTTGVPYLQQLRDRMAALPGVTHVGAINHLPLSGYSWSIAIRRADLPPPDGQWPNVGWRFVWGDYFQAMRIPLVSGRWFSAADALRSAPVALVNTRFAEAQYGSASAAVGRRLVQKNFGAPGETVVEIVGVIGDVRHAALDTPAEPEYIRPLEQTFMFPMQMVARVDGDPAAIVGAMRRAAFEVDAGVPAGDPQTLAAILSKTLGRPRLVAWLLSIFALVGVLLSVVGLYGVIALHVRQREREIGIRMALGATARGVAAAVVRQGIGYAGVGLALGIPAAFALTRLMDSLVYGVTTRDPLTFSALPLVLMLAALVASYAPARRAARVDPAKTIRDSAGL